MNTTLSEIQTAFLPHVSLTPPAIVLTTFRRHPIFWLYKTHVRSIRCELVVDINGIFQVEYIDKRTYKTLKNKKVAERYIGKEIPEHEHVGALYAEEVRKVYTYYICKKCSCFNCLQMEMVFTGPVDIISGPINTTVCRTCPSCNKAIVQMDISSEPCSSNKTNRDQDCDLAR